MGTEGTAAAPAGAQGLLLGFMGSRCCRSTASAHSTCPLHQSSGSARRPSRLGRALAGGREQRKQTKAHKLAESDAFPYPGPELRKLLWLFVGRIPAVRGCWGRARGTPGLRPILSPHTCRAPPPSRPEDSAAALHHSPCTMRCSLPILPLHETAFLSIAWELKKNPSRNTKISVGDWS